MSERFLVIGLVVLAVVLAPSVEAAKWPGPTDAEWKMTEVEGSPNAPAVILERTGHMFIDKDFRSSYLDVYTRLKVLTEEGTEYGSISIFSSDYYRTKNIEGRTHHPDGRVVELPKDATFEREYSDYYDTSVLSSALPEVVEGSILEYGYRIYFDSVFYPRRWYFQAEIPIVSSSITFDMPDFIRFAPVKAVTLRNREMEEEIKETVRGTQAIYTMRDMPPIPDEPAAYPFASLASRVFMLPLTDNTRGSMRPLFESWEKVCDLAWGSRKYGYVQAFADDGKAKKKAKSLGNAEAIYRFVRDEIDTEGYVGIWCWDCSVDDVLSERKGDYAEKALLLYAMLDAVGADPTIAWSCPKTSDYIAPNIPNPAQMESVLVVLDTDEGRVFLDPTDRSLAFGALPPSLQNVQVLLTSRKKPEWVTAPAIDAAGSARDATVKLTVADDGSVSGEGSMVLTGNHGWRRLMWRSTEDAAIEGWTDWLSGELPEFAIADVAVDEDVEASRVEVSWTMSQSEDDVLGDEVSVSPARPLAITSNPFTLPPARRLTPVQLSFPDTDRIHMEITWPEGWVVEGTPDATSSTTGAGTIVTSFEVDEESRVATFDRELVLSEAQFIGGQAYAQLRRLYQAAVDADASAFLLLLE